MDSEVIPPWVRYPNESPHSPFWRQGNAEAYLDYVWRPFYEALPDEVQGQYLDRWNADSEWRDFLSQSFWDELERIDKEGEGPE